jgi:hypothetical protein
VVAPGRGGTHRGQPELHDLTGWLDFLDEPVLHPAGSTLVYSGDPNLFGPALERRLGGEAMDGSWSGAPLLSRPFFDLVFTGNPAHPAYGFYWWLKKPVPADLAAMIDANNRGQYARDMKPHRGRSAGTR